MSQNNEAGSSGSTNNTLKEVLYENLLVSLSHDNQLRANSEQQIKLLESHEEFGLHLVEISLSQSIQFPIRQLSAVLLKQYVSHHWSRHNEYFLAPEVSPQVKTIMKDVLIKSLNSDLQVTEDESKKLRSSLAYVVSGIAHYDWPEEWPQLGPVLIEMLSSNTGLNVYSAMKVFVELVHEVTDNQMPIIAPLLLPKMYQIFISFNDYSIRTRGRAVKIFMTLAETISQMGDYDVTAFQTYLDPILPQFTEALVKVLQMPDSADQVDVGLKKDCIDALTILLKNCTKYMKKWLPQILEPVWNSLITHANIYVKTVVNSHEYDQDHEHFSPTVDSDGEVLGFESLIYSIFDFVSVIIENSKFRKLIKPVMSDLIYYIIIYMQIPDESSAEWLENIAQFVDEEDDESYSYSIRISALDLILSLSKEFEENESLKKYDIYKSCLISAINKHFLESIQAAQKGQGDARNWWKIQEACLLTLGSISMSLVETMQTNSPLAKTMKTILDNVFTISTDVSPFLSGRSLWTASRFAEIMSPEIIDRFLQSTTAGLMSQSPIVRISATRSTWGFIDACKRKKQIDIMKPYLQPMLEGLVAIGTQYSTEVLSLVLETVSVLISLDPDFTASVENKVSPLAIAAFLKYSSDPVLTSVVQDVFAELSRNEKCVLALQTRLLPTLTSILQPLNPNQLTASLQPIALEILTTLVSYSPVPLSQILLVKGFPACAASVVSTIDDTATLQNGGECVRMYLTKSVDQIITFVDPVSNQNGIAIALQVCHHLLDPRINESCSTFVGRLVTVLITRAGQCLGNDNINLLLRSVLVKLQNSEALSVIQSLIVVFAHLINYDLPTILDFLSSLPAPTGNQSALEFVLRSWFNRQHLFFGIYEKKITILALCKLLEHSIVNSSQDAKLNLNHITVPGDAIQSDNNEAGIQTRSKTGGKPVEWTQIPCSVKILKLLLEELNSCKEEPEDQDTLSGNDSEDDDEDQEELGAGDAKAYSAEKHAAINVWLDDEGIDLDDEDVLHAEIGKINIEEHLINILREFKKTPFVNDFASNLTDSEKIALNKV